MENTFDELIEKHQWFQRSDFSQKEPLLDKADVLQLLQQVREATITEAINYCISQDWVKTIDNLKKMPTDRILDFEKPIKLTDENRKSN